MEVSKIKTATQKAVSTNPIVRLAVMLKVGLLFFSVIAISLSFDEKAFFEMSASGGLLIVFSILYLSMCVYDFELRERQATGDAEIKE